MVKLTTLDSWHWSLKWHSLERCMGLLGTLTPSSMMMCIWASTPTLTHRACSVGFQSTSLFGCVAFSLLFLFLFLSLFSFTFLCLFSFSFLCRLHFFLFFLFFISIQSPVYVSAGSKVQVSFWRKVSTKKVWYEWSVTSPTVLPVHNPNGRSYWIGLWGIKLKKSTLKWLVDLISLLSLSFFFLLFLHHERLFPVWLFFTFLGIRTEKKKRK